MCHPFIVFKNHIQAGSKMYFIYLESSLNNVSTSKARVLESETLGEDIFPCAPSMSGLQAAVRGPRCGGPQTRGVPAHGTARGGQGVRHRRQKSQGCATARKSSKSPPPPIVYSALSLLSPHTQSQACDYHSNKAGIQFLFWKTFSIFSSFGSYRMKLVFYMKRWRQFLENEQSENEIF